MGEAATWVTWFTADTLMKDDKTRWDTTVSGRQESAPFVTTVIFTQKARTQQHVLEAGLGDGGEVWVEKRLSLWLQRHNKHHSLQHRETWAEERQHAPASPTCGPEGGGKDEPGRPGRNVSAEEPEEPGLAGSLPGCCLATLRSFLEPRGNEKTSLVMDSCQESDPGSDSEERRVGLALLSANVANVANVANMANGYIQQRSAAPAGGSSERALVARGQQSWAELLGYISLKTPVQASVRRRHADGGLRRATAVRGHRPATGGDSFTSLKTPRRSASS